MKKQQLRDCFDQVKPREELVHTTLDRIHAVQRGDVKTPHRTPNFGFATRLATAACALVLLVGVGVSLGRYMITAPDPSLSPGERVSPSEINEHAQPYEATPNATMIRGAESIIARAKAQGGEWAVAEADVEAFYFLELTDEQRAEGVIHCCAVVLRTKAIVETNAREEHALPVGEAGGTFAARISLTDATDATRMMDAVDSSVLVRLHLAETDGEMAWMIEEFHPVDTPVE